MKTRTFHAPRFILAAACSLTLVLPAAAHARLQWNGGAGVRLRF